MKSGLQWMVIVLLAACAKAGNNPEPANVTPPLPDIIGTWSACKDFLNAQGVADSSERNTYSYANDQQVWTKTTYSAPTCTEDARFIAQIVTSQFLIGNSVQLNTLTPQNVSAYGRIHVSAGNAAATAKQLNIIKAKVTKVPYNNLAYTTLAGTDHSHIYAVGQETDVTDSSGNIPGQEFDLYLVQANQLFFGARTVDLDKSSELKRPTDINFNAPYTKQP